MGITIIYYQCSPSQDSGNWSSFDVPFTVACFSISVALNALLTLLIIVRLILHSRNMRSAMGTTGGASGLYKTIVTMLVESSALYTIGFLLYIGSWGAQSFLVNAFSPLCAETQVRSYFFFFS